MTMPSKRFVWVTAIAAVAGLTIMWLIIGLVMHAPQSTLLWAAVIAIATGTIGATIGLLILTKLIYPNSRSGKESQLTKTTNVNPMEKMYVEYELNNDDVLYFYSYNYEQSPTMGRVRKLIRRMLLTAIAVELLAAAILGAAFGNQYSLPILVLFVLAALTLVYYVSSLSLMRITLKRMIASNYGPRKNKLTGKHKIHISPDAVTDVTDMGESTTFWNAIEWIGSTSQYVFLAVRGSSPYIVPKRAFDSEEAFGRFLDAVKVYYQAAKAS